MSTGATFCPEPTVADMAQDVGLAESDCPLAGTPVPDRMNTEAGMAQMAGPPAEKPKASVKAQFKTLRRPPSRI